MTQNQMKIPTMLQYLFMALGMSSMLLKKSQSWPTIAGINHTQSLALLGRARDQ